jgi:hypothetical protein
MSDISIEELKGRLAAVADGMGASADSYERRDRAKALEHRAWVELHEAKAQAAAAERDRLASEMAVERGRIAAERGMEADARRSKNQHGWSLERMKVDFIHRQSLVRATAWDRFAAAALQALMSQARGGVKAADMARQAAFVATATVQERDAWEQKELDGAEAAENEVLESQANGEG